MSVKACDRSVSNMEFLKNARDIEVNIIKCMVSKPKKYYFFYQKLTDMAIELLNHVKKANSVYVEYYEDAVLRNKEFKMAIAEAQAILSQIEVMYYLFGGNGVSIKFVKNLAEMLNKEIVLIKGVLKNDQSKYERVIGK